MTVIVTRQTGSSGTPMITVSSNDSFIDDYVPTVIEILKKDFAATQTDFIDALTVTVITYLIDQTQIKVGYDQQRGLDIRSSDGTLLNRICATLKSRFA